MKINNRFLIIVFVLLFMFTLTSCIEVYQHIGKNKNGTIHIFTKLSVSKMIMELGNSFSDNPEEIDYDEMLGDFSSEDLSMYESLNPVINKINTEFEFGYSIAFDIDKKDKNYKNHILENDIYFMPLFDDNVIIIRMNSSADNESIDNTAKDFLISSKYRITVSKSIIYPINEVVLEYSDEVISIVPDDLGDSYLIEMPMDSILQNNAVLTIR